MAYDEPEPEGGDVARHDGRAGKGRDAEDEHLGPVRVRRGRADGCRELMVHEVDVVVAPLGVQQWVDPVATEVVQYRTQYLRWHLTTGMVLYADGQRLRRRLFVGAVGV